MRLWSLHPRYLDRQGLTAAWREGLLAQAVLAGRTRGYTRHPQLERFRAQAEPLPALGAYLCAVADEAGRRGYRFDRSRILSPGDPATFSVPVTDGQLLREWEHLGAKLQVRDPERYGVQLAETSGGALPGAHPLFEVRPGPVAGWERAPGLS